MERLGGGQRWGGGDELVWGKFSDVGASGYPFHRGFVRTPYGIQSPAPDGRDVGELRRLFELSGIDDNCEMFLLIFVIVVQVKERRPVLGGYAGASHAPDLDGVRRENPEP